MIRRLAKIFRRRSEPEFAPDKRRQLLTAALGFAGGSLLASRPAGAVILNSSGGGGGGGTPSNANPLMDGVAAPGVATPYTREDHVHPSDTSRVAKAGDTMTGNLTISSNLPTLLINKQITSGQTAGINGRVAGSDRWIVVLGDSASESGGNSGSNFTIQRCNDAGVVMDNPLSITRSNGIVAVNSLYSLATVYENGVALGSTYRPLAPRIGTVASSPTPTPDAASQDQYNVTALAAAALFGAPTGTPVDGQKLIVRIKDNGTARALTWNAVYRGGGDLALPATTLPSRTMYLGFLFNSADSRWDYVSQVGDM